jgi:hypothetical protein
MLASMNSPCQPNYNHYLPVRREKPSCSNCMMRDIECSLQSAAPHLPACNESTPPRGELIPHSGYTIIDMELHHHFTVSTVFPLTSRQDKVENFQRTLPSAAFLDTPLMKSLLALAGLHRVDLSTNLEQQERYSSKATAYQAIALQGFRPRISNLNRENATSVILYASRVMSGFEILVLFCGCRSLGVSSSQGTLISVIKAPETKRRLQGL